MAVEETILAEIRRIMMDAGSETLKITRESSLLEDLDFSSLEVMEMVSFLEDKFALKIRDRELQSIITVGQLIQLIEGKLAG